MYNDEQTKDMSASTLTTMCSLSLPAGTYVITGNVYFSTDNARVYSDIDIDGIVNTADSTYDSSGYIGSNCAIIVELSATSSVHLKAQISKASTGVKGILSAVKVQ